MKFPSQRCGARGTRISERRERESDGASLHVSPAPPCPRPGARSSGPSRSDSPRIRVPSAVSCRLRQPEIVRRAVAVGMRGNPRSPSLAIVRLKPGLAASRRYTCCAGATHPGGIYELAEDHGRPRPLSVRRSVRPAPGIRDRTPQRRAPECRDGLTRCSSCGKRFEGGPFRERFGTSDRSFWNTRSISRYAAGDPDHIARPGNGF